MIKENDYSGIKKKEYDLVCLSMLENISSILKEFNEIQKLFVISCSIQKDKRVHIVTERCIKIISILCNIFEDDKKKELYVSDVIQVLDVVGTFYQKAKGDFASIPFWFKMFKLTHKYVYSLFSLRSISHSFQKLKMYLSKKGETTDDKKRKKTIENLIIYFETEPNAIKFGKCFKVSKKVIDLIIEYSSANN